MCGLNEDMIGTEKHGRLGRFALPKMLVFDHTLAFPRLIWAPLLLFFPLLGYPMLGHVVANRAGHAMHTAFAKRVLDEPDAWTIVELAPEPAAGVPAAVPVRAS